MLNLFLENKHDEKTPLMRALFYYMNLPQLEQIKMDLKHARYEEIKVAGICLRLTIDFRG
jgi:hypothetical protein